MENKKYGIIEESNGVITEFTIFNMISCRSVGGVFKTKEEAKDYISMLEIAGLSSGELSTIK